MNDGNSKGAAIDVETIDPDALTDLDVTIPGWAKEALERDAALAGVTVEKLLVDALTKRATEDLETARRAGKRGIS